MPEPTPAASISCYHNLLPDGANSMVVFLYLLSLITLKPFDTAG